MIKHNKMLALLLVVILELLLPAGCVSAPIAPTLTMALPTPTVTPTELPPIPPTFTLAPSATPIPKLSPSPTAVPVFLNPFSSLKPGQYFTYDIRTGENILGVVSVDGQDKFEFPELRSNYSIPYLSPDRKKIAISRNSPGYPRETLVVMNPEGEKQILVDYWSCYDVAWSPNGIQLIAACGDFLYWFSLNTGEKVALPVECQPSCLAVKWSPDGKWIAFQTGSELNKPSNQPKEGIFLMSTACFVQPAGCATSKVERVSWLPHETPYDWSPDGKYLVISHNFRMAGDIVADEVILDLFNIQTRQVQRSLTIPGFKQGYVFTLAWSPDGKWIAFNELQGLYKVPIEGGAPVLVIDSPFIYQWITIPHPFAPGAKYTITPAGNGLNLRDQPAQAGKPLKVLKAGDEITIVKGPTLADGYTWWQMRTKDGVEGWAEDLPDWYQ